MFLTLEIVLVFEFYTFLSSKSVQKTTYNVIPYLYYVLLITQI